MTIRLTNVCTTILFLLFASSYFFGLCLFISCFRGRCREQGVGPIGKPMKSAQFDAEGLVIDMLDFVYMSREAEILSQAQGT